MKFKKEYLVLLLIIAALSVYLAVRTEDQTHFVLPRPTEVDTQKIDRLAISRDDKTIELTRQDDQWRIAPKNYPADSIKVKNMVKAAADLTITDLISESGNYDRYNLTNEKKTNVKAFSGKDIVRNFDVGGESPTYQHTFIRLENDPKVYQARGRLDQTFNQTVDQLRDTTVLSFQKSDITELVINKGAESLTLSLKEIPAEEKTPSGEDQDKEVSKQESDTAKTKTQWQDPAGRAVDQPTVERLLSDFSLFKCSGFMADDAAQALKNPLWTLTFQSTKGPHSLSVFEKQDAEATEFPARASDSPYAFRIAKSKVESIEKQMDKLLGQEQKAEK